jgi:hypothetical protein
VLPLGSLRFASSISVACSKQGRGTHCSIGCRSLTAIGATYLAEATF